SQGRLRHRWRQARQHRVELRQGLRRRRRHAGGDRRGPDLRRLRLHQGLPGREADARREAAADLRGDEPDPPYGDRPPHPGRELGGRTDESAAAPPTTSRPSSRLKLSVVIPVFNELATLREIVARVAAVDLDKEIILVDDASTDGGRALLERLA